MRLWAPVLAVLCTHAFTACRIESRPGEEIDASPEDGGAPPEDAGAPPDHAQDGSDARLHRVFGSGGFIRAPTYDQECSTSGTCGAGQTCFRLTQEFAVCDAVDTPPAESCTPPGYPGDRLTDECGCNGLTCGAGQTCVAARIWCSCGPHEHNGCVDTPCLSASECPEDSVCTPTSLIVPVSAAPPESKNRRCTHPACRSDADCVDGENGRCSLWLKAPAQQGVMGLSDIRCVYAALPDGGACRGTTAWRVAPSGPTDEGLFDPYTCPELPH